MNNTTDTYDHILSVLGNTLGMELSFTDDTCHLLIDGRWSLNIVRFSAESRIVLSCIVLETIPEEISYTALIDMLGYALNPMFSMGPAVGIDSESDTMIAYISIHLSQFKAEEFPNIVVKFMEFVINIFNYFQKEEENSYQNIISNNNNNNIIAG